MQSHISSKREVEKKIFCTHKGEDNLATNAEFVVMQPQTKEGLWPPEVERGKEWIL